MRNQTFTYLLPLCALLLSNCAQNDVVVPGLDDPKPREVPISFEGNYVNSATHNTNNLCAHHNTMGVWAWCNGMWNNNTPILNNHIITYNENSSAWTYSPTLLWNKGGHYTFFAYAPHKHQTDASVSIDSQTKMLQINNVALHGHNLQNTPSNSMKDSFIDSPDIDWMIDRNGHYAQDAESMNIVFTLQHILAKLNISIQACDKLMASSCISAITADSIIVSALPAQGNFSQKLTNTPALNTPNDDTTEEWTTHSPHLNIKGTNPGNITKEATYLIESLLFPHATSTESTITIYYTFHYSDGQKEECRYRMPLNEAFERFVSGHSYTITYTIYPDHIDYLTNIIEW